MRAFKGIKGIRFQSTAQKLPVPPKRATFRELLNTPTTKSLVLVVIFGSAVTEMMARRKQVESLKETHNTKMLILKDVLQRLKDGENLDVQKELRLLKEDVEIDIDEKLNGWLAAELEEPTEPKAKDPVQPEAPVSKAPSSTYL